MDEPVLILRRFARYRAERSPRSRRAPGMRRAGLLVGPLVAAAAVLVIAQSRPATTPLAVTNQPTAASSCAGVGEPQDRLYVGLVYQVLLQRAPDPAECGDWVTRLEQPGMTRAKEALAIIKTPEFAENQISYTYRA